jgi:hypothetical protein
MRMLQKLLEYEHKQDVGYLESQNETNIKVELLTMKEDRYNPEYAMYVNIMVATQQQFL